MDIIFIEQLRIPASIGVYDWEKACQQPLLFDIHLGCHIKKAAASDDIQESLDYSAVCRAVENYLNQQHFALLERVAEEVAQHLLLQFGVPWIRLKVSKPQAIFAAQQVGVVIERTHPGAQSTASLC